MVSRTATATTPCAVEWCPWFGNLAALPHCPWCRKHHPLDYKHPGDCTVKGCRGRAIVYQGKAGLHCREHSVEDANDKMPPRVTGGRYAAFLEASKPLADLMPKAEPLPHLDDSEADFVAWSNSNHCYLWPMVWTPEGYAVHFGEGCIGEQKRGVLGCHHSTDAAK